MPVRYQLLVSVCELADRIRTANCREVEWQVRASDPFKYRLAQLVSIDAYKSRMNPVDHLLTPYRIGIGLAENHVTRAHTSSLFSSISSISSSAHLSAHSVRGPCCP